MISERTIHQVREAARIEEVVGDFVTLKRSGSAYKACCPFHQEKTPSFHVNPRGFYKCFGCGKGGDIITFLMDRGNSFSESVEHLAKKYSIPVEYEKTDTPRTTFPHMAVGATLAAIQAHVAAQDDNPGRKYFAGRGFNEATLDEYGIGYAGTATVPHITPEMLEQAGLSSEKGNFTMYKRATIPVHDARGRLVSFAGRTLETGTDTPKYINGRGVEGLYKKGEQWFNLHRADAHIRRTGEVWIVEGYADSMAMTQMGRPQNVALCGTAITPAHVAALKKYSGDKPLRIVLGIDAQTDPGAPGYKPEVAAAMWAAVKMLLEIGEVRIVQWPRGCKDAGEVLEKGIDAQKITTADAIEYYILQNITKEWSETASPVEKSVTQDEVAGMIARVGKDNARDIYINSLAANLEITPKRLEELVKKFRGKHETEHQNRHHADYVFIKVRDEYLERIPRPDLATGSASVVYVTRKVAELKLEKGLQFIREIPKFHDWVTEPSHTDYKRVIEYSHEGNTFRFFNRYQPLPYQPKEFALPAEFVRAPDTFDYTRIQEIENTAKFMAHIFDQKGFGQRFLQIGWDWLTLLYLNPKQRLPALALVSSDEGTGKSTFINLALKIFGQNATKTDASRIGGNFNAQMSGKVFVGVEETKDEKGSIENKLKDLITGFSMVIERKFQDAQEEESFAKFCFASNHEDSFMKVGTTTTRFFVMRVNPIPENSRDPYFEEKLYREIPYLLHFMKVRGVLYNQGQAKNRLFFDPADLENEALLKLRQSSKDIVQQNVEELVSNIFLRTEVPIPIIRMGSEYLKTIMVVYGGKLYDQKTPNYFMKVCTSDMRLEYKDKPTTFRMVELTDIHKTNWVTAQTWPYELATSKGRYIEFPIWKFCTPEEVVDNYDRVRVDQLLAAFGEQMADLKKRYGAQAEEWANKLQKIFIETKTGVTAPEKMPF